MIQEFTSHKKSYVILIVFLLAFVLAFLHAWPNHFYQEITVVVACIFYFLWGLVVHAQQGYVSGKVVFEYFAVSVLAGCLLFLLLL